jgi:hypothetical protein
MRKRVVFALLALAGLVSAEAAGACTIHLKKGTPEGELTKLAQFSFADAERIARARLDNRGGISVVSAELEVEHGCLLWSFDLRISGETGFSEVQIDAGDGRVLSVKHETAQQEAAEAKGEATKKPHS